MEKGIMTAQILDGNELAKTIRAELKEKVSAFTEQTSVQPTLAVILVGEDPASKVYVRNKSRDCERAGMKSIQHNLPESTSQEDLLKLIDSINADSSIHGLLVQLPVPKQIDTYLIQERVLPEKDVDGFHPVNVGRLWTGQNCFVPCTPLGVIEILKRANIEIKGKKAVIIGRSNIVGKPMAQLLIREHATVTVCHSRTKEII
jgi:methylenetetrahydrofolate dehydrogenase (NADP+)/methenyltetrahydrofolate cyclohydrolase